MTFLTVSSGVQVLISVSPSVPKEQLSLIAVMRLLASSFQLLLASSDQRLLQRLQVRGADIGRGGGYQEQHRHSRQQRPHSRRQTHDDERWSEIRREDYIRISDSDWL